MRDDEGAHALRDRAVARRFLIASLWGLLGTPSIGRAEPAARPARIG